MFIKNKDSIMILSIFYQKHKYYLKSVIGFINENWFVMWNISIGL